MRQRKPTGSSTSAQPGCLAGAVIRWFRAHARPLPWRGTTEPYAVWISEIMLQQTQAAAVIPYWTRWMRQLPDIRSLAKASSTRLHKLWEGLGYYTRVKNLQRAAHLILSKHGGTIPSDHQALLSLPGIGPYTAGAICSIAFNLPEPIVDGNVARVLARLFAIRGDLRKNSANRELWARARELVVEASTCADERACSHFNQGLIELGALVCTPRNPQCTACPLEGHCEARRTNRVSQIPKAGRRPKTSARRFIGFAIEDDGRVLVRQRPSGVVNSLLWELPNIEAAHAGMDSKAAARALLGITAGRLTPICSIKHSITRYRMTLEIYRAALKSDLCLRLPEGAKWVSRRRLAGLPFPSAHRKAIRQAFGL